MGAAATVLMPPNLCAFLRTHNLEGYQGGSVIDNELNRPFQSNASFNSMTVADVQIAVANAAFGFEQLPKSLRKMLEQEAWRRFNLPDVSAVPEEGDVSDAEIEYKADEFEVFCAADPPRGLGISVERLMHLIAGFGGEDAEVALQMMRLLLTPLQPHGGEHREAAARSEVGSRPRSRRGAGYQLRRLKRDHPAVAAEVVAGKLSPNAAAVRAGLQKRYLKIPANPWFAAERLHAQGAEWIGEMMRALEARIAESRRCAESEGKPLANTQVSPDRGQIELPLTDRNHEPTITLRLAGEWLAPPGDPLFVPSPGAELPEIASISVAKLDNGGLLAYVRAGNGDGYSTMALLFGDPAELAPQDLPLDLVKRIEGLIRGRWSAKSSCRSASTSRSVWSENGVPEAS
jgi:hypothetical protein